MASNDKIAIGIFLAISALVVSIVFLQWLRLRRAEFIRTYTWPPGLLDRLEKHRPELSRKDTALVSHGLRQFFLAYLMSGQKYVSMPSQVVDDLWHEFILYTREYQRFCKRAFGGFLHHTPAVALGNVQQKGNEGLRRVWSQSCKYENINPVRPSRLPLLFALDSKLRIAEGFEYHPQCDELRQISSDAVIHCGTDFSNKSIDGSIAGFTNSSGGGEGPMGFVRPAKDTKSKRGSCGGGGCGGGGDGGCGGGGD